jgi:hypothetical protein
MYTPTKLVDNWLGNKRRQEKKGLEEFFIRELKFMVLHLSVAKFKFISRLKTLSLLHLNLE